MSPVLEIVQVKKTTVNCWETIKLYLLQHKDEKSLSVKVVEKQKETYR